MIDTDSDRVRLEDQKMYYHGQPNSPFESTYPAQPDQIN